MKAKRLERLRDALSCGVDGHNKNYPFFEIYFLTWK